MRYGITIASADLAAIGATAVSGPPFTNRKREAQSRAAKVRKQLAGTRNPCTVTVYDNRAR